MYQALIQHTKEHEMTVKDFNQNKSNGGIATATTIGEIKTSSSGKAMATEPRLDKVRHVAQHGTRNVTNLEIKIILVHVVGQNRRTQGTAKDLLMAGAP